jgi:hypothetical protein
MPWIKLDDLLWSKPKVVAAGNEATGAYCRMLSFCGNQLTDGVVNSETAKFIAPARVQKLLEQHNFVERDGSDLLIPDYLEFNPSREEVESKRKVRAEAGKRGGVASGIARGKK